MAIDKIIASSLADNAITSDKIAPGAITIDDLAEGTSNLFYTDARADARIDLETGINLDLSQKTTTDLAEGTNLYYTNARVDARINAVSGGPGITISSNVEGNITISNDLGNVVINTASNGEVLTYSNGNWINQAAGVTPGSLDPLVAAIALG